MTEMTPRLGLPLLAPGQAQKEVTHNEAIALTDIMLQPVVLSSGLNAPPADPVAGQCWIIGPAPTGAWSGKAGWLAGYTVGGWRFVAPFEAMAVHDLSSGLTLRRIGTGWIAGQVDAAQVRIGGNLVLGSRQPAIANPSGGSVTDTEGRIAIGAILAALRTHGIIAT